MCGVNRFIVITLRSTLSRRNGTCLSFIYGSLKIICTGCLNIHGAQVTANNSTTNNIGCLNIQGTQVTANNSTNNNIGCLNILGTQVTANNSTNNNIGCLNIQGTQVTANNSTNSNNVVFFCFRFENSIL